MIIIGVFLLSNFILCRIYSNYRKKKESSVKISSGSKETDVVITPRKSTFKGRLRYIIDQYMYGWVRYNTILIGKIPSNRIRKLVLSKMFIMKIDKNAVIHGGFEIRSPWNITIGRSVIGVGALLDGRKGISIGNNVCLAQNVMIFTKQHDINDPYFRCNDKDGSVVIEDYVWLSSRSTVLPRVRVKKGAVLASGAIATKDLEEYGVYVGIPAKKVSERNSDLRYTLGGKDSWHFY